MTVAKFSLLIRLSLFVAASPYAWSQPSLRGTLAAQGAASLGDYSVVLCDLSSRNEVARADVDAGGYFAFQGISSGNYAVRVTNTNGQVVREDFVTITDRNTPLHIAIDSATAGSSVRRVTPGDVISLKQLQHPPSKKAMRAFEAAAKFSQEGQFAQAMEKLQEAIRNSPNFAAAYSNLAAQHIRLSRYEEGAAECRKAMELSAPNPRDLTNLAVALAGLNHIPDAISEGERALSYDSGFVFAHFVLGALEVISPETRASGIRHLERAAPEVPGAARALARVQQAMNADASANNTAAKTTVALTKP